MKIAVTVEPTDIPSGFGLVPSGGIIMWKGLISTIPTGWILCNGSGGTPDLRDKFIVGARQDEGGAAKTNITGVLDQIGGVLEHQHNFTGTQLDPAGNAIISNAPNGNVGAAIVDGQTDTAAILPPFYALAFIMKF